MKKNLFTLIVFFAILSLAVAQQVPRKMVCMEIETSTLCTFCPGAAMGAEELLANGKQVAVVESHCNGLGQDPFSNAGALSRETVYNAPGYPTTTFDGISGLVGGSHTQSLYSYYLPMYNARIGVGSPIDMAMTFTNSGLHYDLTITVTKVDAVTAATLKLFVFVTESNISYNWQGQTKLHFLNRTMIPDKNGTTIDFSSGNTQTYNLSVDLNSAWKLNNCEFTATVQNMDVSQGTFNAGGSYMLKKREEYQAIKSGVIPLTVDFSADKDTVNPGDNIQFTDLTAGGYVNVPVTYEWLFPGGNPAVSYDKNPMISYPGSGVFDVTLVINKGGEIDTVTKPSFITVNPGVGFRELTGGQITVSPNPGSENINLTFNVGKPFVADLSIMNLAGKTVYIENNITVSNNLTKTIPVYELPAGEYILAVQNDATRLVRKILIN